jgi:hypothetical protein
MEILANQAPPFVLRPAMPSGSRHRLRRIDYVHHGTRRRSMFRYCNALERLVLCFPGCDARALTSEGERVLVWDDMEPQPNIPIAAGRLTPA